MGVKDLWTILEPVKSYKTLNELSGQIIAIDLSIWIMEVKTLQAKGVVKPHLRHVFFRVWSLLQLGIVPVIVIEGKPPDLKQAVMKKRVAVQHGARFVSHDSQKISRKRFTADHRECCEMLDYLGVPYIESSGEAEAMCAFLDRNHLVDGCITNDGDAFLYGATTVYRNFTTNIKDPHVESYSTEDIADRLQLDRERLVALAVLLGCDYLEKGIPGVGRELAIKFLSGLDRRQSVLSRFESWAAAAKQSCSPAGIVIKSPEWYVWKKALLSPGFPHHDVTAEFLTDKDTLPSHRLTWRRPKLFHFIRFTRQKMDWSEEYGLEKVLPLVTLYDMRSLGCGKISRDCLKPHRIVKARVRHGVTCFEVEWFKIDGDVVTKTDYYVTIEEQRLFEKAFPDIVSVFQQQLQQRKPSGRAKTRGATKTRHWSCESLSEIGNTDIAVDGNAERSGDVPKTSLVAIDVSTQKHKNSNKLRRSISLVALSEMSQADEFISQRVRTAAAAAGGSGGGGGGGSHEHPSATNRHLSVEKLDTDEEDEDKKCDSDSSSSDDSMFDIPLPLNQRLALNSLLLKHPGNNPTNQFAAKKPLCDNVKKQISETSGRSKSRSEISPASSDSRYTADSGLVRTTDYDFDIQNSKYCSARDITDLSCDFNDNLTTASSGSHVSDVRCEPFSSFDPSKINGLGEECNVDAALIQNGRQSTAASRHVSAAKMRPTVPASGDKHLEAFVESWKYYSGSNHSEDTETNAGVVVASCPAGTVLDTVATRSLRTADITDHTATCRPINKTGSDSTAVDLIRRRRRLRDDAKQHIANILSDSLFADSPVATGKLNNNSHNYLITSTSSTTTNDAVHSTDSQDDIIDRFQNSLCIENGHNLPTSSPEEFDNTGEMSDIVHRVISTPHCYTVGRLSHNSEEHASDLISTPLCYNRSSHNSEERVRLPCLLPWSSRHFGNFNLETSVVDSLNGETVELQQPDNSHHINTNGSRRIELHSFDLFTPDDNALKVDSNVDVRGFGSSGVSVDNVSMVDDDSCCSTPERLTLTLAERLKRQLNAIHRSADMERVDSPMNCSLVDTSLDNESLNNAAFIDCVADNSSNVIVID